MPKYPHRVAWSNGLNSQSSSSFCVGEVDLHPDARSLARGRGDGERDSRASECQAVADERAGWEAHPTDIDDDGQDEVVMYRRSPTGSSS